MTLDSRVKPLGDSRALGKSEELRSSSFREDTNVTLAERTEVLSRPANTAPPSLMVISKQSAN